MFARLDLYVIDAPRVWNRANAFADERAAWILFHGFRPIKFYKSLQALRAPNRIKIAAKYGWICFNAKAIGKLPGLSSPAKYP